MSETVAGRAAPESVDHARIPLVEEEVSIGKRSVETGRVRIRTKVDEERLNLSEMLEHDVVDVERVPVGTEVQTAPAPFEDDGVLVVPIVEERLVVEKRLVVVEELRIRRRHVQERIDVPVSRRSMRAEVERLPADDPPGSPIHPDRPVGSVPERRDPPSGPMPEPEAGKDRPIPAAAFSSREPAIHSAGDAGNQQRNWLPWIVGGVLLLALLLGIADWLQDRAAAERTLVTAARGAGAIAGAAQGRSLL